MFKKIFKNNSKVSTMSRCYTGFTLAEVLITLGVIGIVAAMTIPTIINVTSDAELKAAWKKEFSVITQATQMFINDNGGGIAGACVATSASCFAGLFQPYLKVVKTCDSTQTASCWSGTYTQNSGVFTGGLINAFYTPYTIVLEDGSVIMFDSTHSGCGSSESLVAAPWSCGKAYVDVNGNKKPNTPGRDQFAIQFYDTKKPTPMGGSYNDKTCAVNGGVFCSYDKLYN